MMKHEFQSLYLFIMIMLIEQRKFGRDDSRKIFKILQTESEGRMGIGLLC